MRMASMTVSRQWSISSQQISTVTCTAALRVWHFSAFHLHRCLCVSNLFSLGKLVFAMLCSTCIKTVHMNLIMWQTSLRAE